MTGPRSPADLPGRRAGRRLAALVLGLGLAAAAADAGRARLAAWIDATPLPSLAVATGTEVLARDGSLLRAFQVEDGIWRLAPPDSGVDPGYLAMLLEWEDRRFRQHAGVDPRAVLRAAAQALRHRRVVSGASTLSMQVARLLERGPTGDWRGKLRQARLAMALERRLGKDRILDLYLRLAPYGGNVEGVRAASLMWLGKEPRRLTPAEAALLVALPQAPEARRPDRPEGRRAAMAARNRVLAQARAAGLIDAEAEATARAVPLPSARRPFPAHAALLAERLRRASPGAPRIETTIDPGLQRAAEAIIARATRGQSARVSAAALIADHRTGEILASVGTAQWSDEPSAGFVDMTEAIRSPGSTLKPFVFALGFEDGLIHPGTLIEDRPTSFGRWQPVNFDRRFRGPVTIRQALTESLNIPVVRVAAALGPARIAATLRRAGMRIELSGGVPGLAMVLGGAGVSLRDLVQGYAALGNGGLAVRLHERPGSSSAMAGADAPASLDKAGGSDARGRGGPAGQRSIPPDVRADAPGGQAAAPTPAAHNTAASKRPSQRTGDPAPEAKPGTTKPQPQQATEAAAPSSGVAPARVPAMGPALATTSVPAHGFSPLAASTPPGAHEASRAAAPAAMPSSAAAGLRVFSPVAAWYVGSILSHIPPPTGAEPGRIAYKTGTSYGNRDALAVGYDGRFVAGVWLGRPDGTPVPGAFGGALAAPVLFDLFDALGPRRSPLPPPPPLALTGSTARLPVPLRRFLAPGEASPVAKGSGAAPAERLTILFPPNGAAVEMAAGGTALTARLRGGAAPFTWVLNGLPVARTPAGETATLPAPGPGFATLSVVDAEGRAARTGFEIVVPGG